MTTGHATRVLVIASLIAAWACRAEPGDPDSAQRPTAAGSSPRPEVNPAAPNAATGQDTAAKHSAVDGQAMFRAMLEGKPPPEPPLVRARAVWTGNPELDPLVSFLRGAFAEELKAGKTLIIEDHTTLYERGESHQAYIDSLLKEASDRVPGELIRDLGDKNRQSHVVWPELGRHVPVHLLSPEDKRAIFQSKPDTSWERFYEKYPGSPGLIAVSRVGLNHEQYRALFYMSVMRGPENGWG